MAKTVLICRLTIFCRRVSLICSRDLRINDTLYVSATDSSFQAQLAASRRATFACSRLVSIPPCLRPIEEEDTSTDSDVASSSSSSSYDEIMSSDDELSNLSVCTNDNDALVQAAAISRRFDNISSANVSFHNGKHV